MSNNRVALHIVGDSQITLSRARKMFDGQSKLPKKTTAEFREALCKLDESLRPFMEISIEWQPRLKSVATFGH